MTPPAPKSKEELDPIDGFLLVLLGDHHRHLCVSCDGAEGGCINCRHTGYDQTPCKICDKDGIAFKNRKEFLDKVKSYYQQQLERAVIKELQTLLTSAQLFQEAGISLEYVNLPVIENRIAELQSTINEDNHERSIT